MTTSANYDYAIQFYCEIRDQKVVIETVDGFTMIGSLTFVRDDLDFNSDNANDFVEGDDNVPKEDGWYHVYVVGHYWYDTKDYGDGQETDVDFEIDTVSYWKY